MGELFSNDFIKDIDMELVPLTDKEKKSGKIEVNDLLFARQSLTLEGAGKCSIVIETSPLTVFESHLIRVRLNQEIASPLFFYYYFKSPFNPIKNIVSQAVQAGIKASELATIKVKIPPISEQKRIAVILSALDEKIETNRKINARLEELAQAIFKSWFIDFEPFGGKMPADWVEGAAEDFFRIDIGKTPPRKENHWFSNNNNDVTWVSISDMGKSGMFISQSSEMLTEDALTKFNIAIVHPNTILLSFKLTIGRVCIANSNLTTNEAIARFRLNNSFEREFLYFLLKEYDYNSLGSTSSIATAVNSKIIKGMSITMPTEEVLKQFSGLISPIFDRIESLTKELERLAELRDTLLPKLMSGELIPE